MIRSAIVRLAEAGCDTPRLDAELLLADALGIERLELYTRERIDPPPDFEERIERRAAGEPVASRDVGAGLVDLVAHGGAVLAASADGRLRRLGLRP